MRLVLDSDGVGTLVRRRALVVDLRRRSLWPPLAPAVVLTDSLTGDLRRDHAVAAANGGSSTVLTSNPRDLSDLAEHSPVPVFVLVG